MKNKIFFVVLVITIVVIGILYAYMSNNSQNKTVTTIPEEDRILVKDGCKIVGCSGTICMDENEEWGWSFCNWSPIYACYKDAYTTCERQSSGRCAWTNTPEFRACLDSPPSLNSK